MEEIGHRFAASIAVVRCFSMRQRARGPSSPPANRARSASLGCPMKSKLIAFAPSYICGTSLSRWRYGSVRSPESIPSAWRLPRRAAFHVAKDQRSPLPRRQQPQTVLNVLALFRPQDALLGILSRHLGSSVQLFEGNAFPLADEIKRRVDRNSAQPLGRLPRVLKLRNGG